MAGGITTITIDKCYFMFEAWQNCFKQGWKLLYNNNNNNNNNNNEYIISIHIHSGDNVAILISVIFAVEWLRIPVFCDMLYQKNGFIFTLKGKPFCCCPRRHRDTLKCLNQARILNLRNIVAVISGDISKQSLMHVPVFCIFL